MGERLGGQVRLAAWEGTAWEEGSGEGERGLRGAVGGLCQALFTLSEGCPESWPARQERSRPLGLWAFGACLGLMAKHCSLVLRAA